MKALIFDGPWRLRLADLPVPRPQDHEVLLRPLAVGICGSDVHGFTGESGRRKPGMVMGHEVVAQVMGLGAKATRFREGDRVAVYNIDACGRCPECAAGQEQRCPDKRVLGVNAGTWGAMAEYFVFPESGLFPISPTIDPAIGLLAEPLAVGVHAASLAPVPPEGAVVVVGAGTIGIGLTLALRARGVHRISVLDRVVEKLDFVASFGASPVHVDREDAAALVRQATNGRRADAVFEAVGLADTVRTAYALCAPGGTLVLVGNLAKEFSLPLQDVTGNETVIRGSYGFSKRDFSAAIDLVHLHHASLARMISGSCSLAETPDVMTRMGRGEAKPIKMIIRP